MRRCTYASKAHSNHRFQHTSVGLAPWLAAWPDSGVPRRPTNTGLLCAGAKQPSSFLAPQRQGEAGWSHYFQLHCLSSLCLVGFKGFLGEAVWFYRFGTKCLQTYPKVGEEVMPNGAYSKSLFKTHSLNHHLENHLHKNCILYLSNL
jgi:hypothetical protein